MTEVQARTVNVTGHRIDGQQRWKVTVTTGELTKHAWFERWENAMFVANLAGRDESNEILTWITWYVTADGKRT